jgi:hypothetical protein
MEDELTSVFYSLGLPRQLLPLDVWSVIAAELSAWCASMLVQSTSRFSAQFAPATALQCSGLYLPPSAFR